MRCQPSRLIGLLSFKFVGDGKEAAHSHRMDRAAVQVKGLPLLCSSTQGGGGNGTSWWVAAVLLVNVRYRNHHLRCGRELVHRTRSEVDYLGGKTSEIMMSRSSWSAW